MVSEKSGSDWGKIEMYTVEFYEKADGRSELWDFLEDLRRKAATSKDARIQ